MTFVCPDCGMELLANVKDFASRAESRRVEMLLVDRHKERGNCKPIEVPPAVGPEGIEALPIVDVETWRTMAELRGEI